MLTGQFLDDVERAKYLADKEVEWVLADIDEDIIKREKCFKAMNENLDLTTILRGCEGVTLYSPMFGEVKLVGVLKAKYSDGSPNPYPISVQTHDCGERKFTADGHCFRFENGERMLFPSKECRDWSKWRVSRPDLPKDTVVFRPRF